MIAQSINPQTVRLFGGPLDGQMVMVKSWPLRAVLPMGVKDWCAADDLPSSSLPSLMTVKYRQERFAFRDGDDVRIWDAGISQDTFAFNTSRRIEATMNLLAFIAGPNVWSSRRLPTHGDMIIKALEGSIEEQRIRDRMTAIKGHEPTFEILDDVCV